MSTFRTYHKLFVDYLKSTLTDKSPKSLYEPTTYILNLGGKRIRPILVLISAHIFEGKVKNALPAALAIEIFHNFSLVHDDIMDNAPLRRGKETVHQKWDLNTAILSGDVMLIWSYEILQQYPIKISSALTKIFSETARKVCEGQQLDMDFPRKKNISMIEYMKMIEFKTAALLGCAMSVGAIISGASMNQIQKINSIGIELGLIFQLQDDYLDIFGSSNKIGKQIGGDIIENKKTFLHVFVKENGSSREISDFNNFLKLKPKESVKKITEITKIYDTSGATIALKNTIKSLKKSVFKKIEKLNIDESKQNLIISFFNKIIERDF